MSNLGIADIGAIKKTDQVQKTELFCSFLKLADVRRTAHGANSFNIQKKIARTHGMSVRSNFHSSLRSFSKRPKGYTSESSEE